MGNKKKRQRKPPVRIDEPELDEAEALRLMEEVMADPSIGCPLAEEDGREDLDIEASIEEALADVDIDALMSGDFSEGLRKLREDEEESATDESPGRRISFFNDPHFYLEETSGLLTFNVHNRGERLNLSTRESNRWFDQLVRYAEANDQDRVLIIHGGLHGTAWREEMWRYFGRSRCEYVFRDTVSVVYLKNR